MKLNDVSAEYKRGVYEKLKKWDEWLVKYRFNRGLCETFCGFDTGHDLSMRHDGFGKYETRFFADASERPTDSDVLPEVMPDISVAASDKLFVKNREGNSWNYFCQGLTMLRTLLWMDDYGLSNYLESNMEKWVTAFTLDETRPFSQELDTFTRKPSPSSTYYSSTMLFYLHALKRMGI